MQSTDVPNNGLAYPVDPAVVPQPALDPRLHARAAGRIQHPVRRERRRGAARRGQPDGRLHRQPAARTCSCAASANTFDNVTRVRPVPAVGQVDYKTSGCLDGLVINGNAISGCGEASYNALQIGADAGASAPASRAASSISTRRTRARRRARTRRRPRRTRSTTTPSSAPTRRTSRTLSTARSSTCFPGEGLWTGGWRVGGIVNARSGVPINVTISRAGQR